MNQRNLERMADGLIHLRTELQRRKEPGDVSTHDLSTSQAQALRLVIFEGPQRIGSLAKHLGVTMATASRTVDALVAADLVHREPDPLDARAVRVVLTARGRREHDGDPEHEEMPNHAWSSLPSAVITFMTTPILAPRSPG